MHLPRASELRAKPPARLLIRPSRASAHPNHLADRGRHTWRAETRKPRRWTRGRGGPFRKHVLERSVDAIAVLDSRPSCSAGNGSSRSMRLGIEPMARIERCGPCRRLAPRHHQAHACVCPGDDKHTEHLLRSLPSSRFGESSCGRLQFHFHIDPFYEVATDAPPATGLYHAVDECKTGLGGQLSRNRLETGPPIVVDASSATGSLLTNPRDIGMSGDELNALRR